MMRLAAKLGFVHRTLWQRDTAYRWAVLLGPPPLLGCALVATVWFGLTWAGLPHRSGTASTPGAEMPWATWNRPAPQEAQPFEEAPFAPLPKTDASGRYVGVLPGWSGAVHPMTVDAVMAITVNGPVVAQFALDQTTIPLSRIIDAGPPGGLFLGTALGFFVVRTPGVYAFSMRFTRSSPVSVDCTMRLSTPKHRLINNTMLNASGDTVVNYPAAEFRLEPGLHLLGLGLSCWRGDRMMGPGEVTLMVRAPGEAALRPAAPEEIVRPTLPFPPPAPR